MMAEKQYDFAIREYLRLCDARQDHSFWMSNIIDATYGLTDDIAWQNFYSFLSDDSHIFRDILSKTLGQCIEDGTTFPDNPIQFDIVEVENGDITHIKLTPNVMCINKKTDGKSLVNISQRIQEEKSGAKPKGLDEKRQLRI
jgi:hypothetical protein